MSQKIYILTKQYNAYDQYGEYFVAAFKGLPSKEQLTKRGVPEYEIEHVLKGGGRVRNEDQWFNLNQERLE